MSELKCPYCPATRPTRYRIEVHLNAAHRGVSQELRAVAVEPARPADDAAETASSETAPVVRCVCGSEIEPLDGDTEYPDWMHVAPMPKCHDAIPAAGMPTKQDRANLDTGLSRVGAGLAEAGREMAAMRAALDAVDERMQRLDAQLTSPATVRRATLNQAWDRLLDAGCLTGAAIIMKMINAVVDDQ